MKRIWEWALVLPVALALLAPFASNANASPFVVGSTTCGDLKKARNVDGQVIWALTNCDKLENMLKDTASCGNGVLDPGEFCESGVAGNCGANEVCVNCASCQAGGGGPTPTPVPTKTPGPGQTGSAACPAGTLDLANISGFPTWRGRERLVFDGGSSQTFCADVNVDTTGLNFSVGDVGQCADFRLTVTPPTDSGLRSASDQAPWYVSIFFSSATGAPLPHGTWLMKIENVGTCGSTSTRAYWSPS